MKKKKQNSTPASFDSTASPLAPRIINAARTEAAYASVPVSGPQMPQPAQPKKAAALPSDQEAAANPAGPLNPSTIIDAQLRHYHKLNFGHRLPPHFDFITLLIYISGFLLLIGLTVILWPSHPLTVPHDNYSENNAEPLPLTTQIKIQSNDEVQSTSAAVTQTTVNYTFGKDIKGRLFYGKPIGPNLIVSRKSDLRLPRLPNLSTAIDADTRYLEWEIQHTKLSADNHRLPVISDNTANYCATYNVLWDLNPLTLKDMNAIHRSYLEKAEKENKKHPTAPRASTGPDATVQQVAPAAPTASSAKRQLTELQKANAKYRPEKVIYITYDFVKGEKMKAKQVLDILKAYQIPCSFFIGGDFLSEAPDLVLRMDKENHCIGSLGWDFEDSARLSIRNRKTFLKSLHKLEKNFELLTGRQLDSFYRPPSGSYSELTLALVRNSGYYPTFWGLELHNFWPDAKDKLNFRYDKLRNRNYAKLPYTVPEALNYIERELHDGLILRLDGRSQVEVDLLEPLIKKIKVEGYTCLNLNEIPLSLMS